MVMNSGRLFRMQESILVVMWENGDFLFLGISLYNGNSTNAPFLDGHFHSRLSCEMQHNSNRSNESLKVSL